MRKPFLVLSTTASRKEAEILAKKILKSKLAACVNIIHPVTSLFWWKGKIDHAKEAVLLIKTRKKNFPLLDRFIRKNHSYNVPEIIGFSIEKGNAAYLEWLFQTIGN